MSFKDVPIASQAFPGLPTFLRRRLRVQTNFGVRLYVSVVAGGSTTTAILPQAFGGFRGIEPLNLRSYSSLC
ncbi:hypothetical protein [Phormidesmis priestleyi]